MAKKSKDTDRLVAECKRELDSINLQLKAAYDRFNYASEPELVDASIYEISALKSKYDYFLRCIKEQTGAPVRRPRPAASPQAAVTEGGQACHL